MFAPAAVSAATWFGGEVTWVGSDDSVSGAWGRWASARCPAGGLLRGSWELTADADPSPAATCSGVRPAMRVSVQLSRGPSGGCAAGNPGQRSQQRCESPDGPAASGSSMIALARINRSTSFASFSPAAPCNSVHPIQNVRRFDQSISRLSGQNAESRIVMARRSPGAAIGPLLPVLCIAAIAFLPTAAAFAPCVGLRCASPLPTSHARRPQSLTRILALDPFAAAAALGSTHAAAKRLILESVAVVRPH